MEVPESITAYTDGNTWPYAAYGYYIPDLDLLRVIVTTDLESRKKMELLAILTLLKEPMFEKVGQINVKTDHLGIARWYNGYFESDNYPGVIKTKFRAMVEDIIHSVRQRQVKVEWIPSAQNLADPLLRKAVKKYYTPPMWDHTYSTSQLT